MRTIQDFFTMSSGKRKRDDFASQYNAGGYIPQQDGAGDAASGVFQIEVWFFFQSANIKQILMLAWCLCMILGLGHLGVVLFQISSVINIILLVIVVKRPVWYDSMGIID